MWAIFWKCFQPLDAVFVGAVFAPHHRVDAHFSEVWRASEYFGDFVEFIRAKAHFASLVKGGDLRGGGHEVGI